MIGGNWQTSFYGYDGHGSVRLLTDAAGAVTDTYTYDAFGGLIERTGNTPNDYLYSGEQYDANLAFYYLRARYMNPSSGRFWSMDTYEGSPFDPQSLHKYAYAQSNPVNLIDPSGHTVSTEQLGAITVIGIIASVAILAAATHLAAKIGETIDHRRRNSLTTVYRGTDRVLENAVFDQTGHILSDAALTAYAGGKTLAEAYAIAGETHREWIKEFGNELAYASAHAQLGGELSRTYNGRERTFVSVTTDPERAVYFATINGRPGRVYKADVSFAELLVQPLHGANEGELLIRLGRGGFSVYR